MLEAVRPEAATPLVAESTRRPARPARAIPVHPLLAAAFPILALYAHNIGQIPMDQMWRPLGLTVGATLVLWVVLAALTRQVRKSALVASVAVLGFYSYGHALNLAPAELRGLVGPVSGIALAAVVAALLTARRAFRGATNVANLVTLVLVAPSGWTIGMSVARDAPAGASGSAQSLPQLVRPATLPDIYCIVLDGYGRQDSLKAFYGIDNESFVEALRQRAFWVAARSRSNYNQTHLCMASELNFQYLERLAAASATTTQTPEDARKMIDGNLAAAALRSIGYRFAYIWTGYGPTQVSSADLVLDNRSPISAFEAQVLGISALDVAPKTRGDLYGRHRGYIEASFRHLAAMPRLAYPKFVVAHILCPHPPFVFDANGKPVDPSGPYSGDDASWLVASIGQEGYRRGYSAQLAYVNKRVLETVDSILKQSKTPPIIILQGDHGSRMTMDWDAADKSDLRECFSILNAYRVPKTVREGLYDTITPVNTFRVLLSRGFGAKLDLLPDRSYYATAWTPYLFEEMTQRIPAIESADAH